MDGFTEAEAGLTFGYLGVLVLKNEIFSNITYYTAYSVLITNEMQNSYSQVFIPHFFCLLYMFRTNLAVHHEEHGIIYCIAQFGTISTIVLSGESS